MCTFEQFWITVQAERYYGKYKNNKELAEAAWNAGWRASEEENGYERAEAAYMDK
jgi:hypothetical protein